MRIVSLLPSATEIVYLLGLGEQLVGVTHECDYPDDALFKPKLTRSHIVGVASDAETVAASIDRQVRESLHDGRSLYDLDAELLGRLAPDLILTQELCDVCAVSYSLLRAALARLGLTTRVLSLEPTTLAGVYDTIAAVGDAANVRREAEAVVAALRARADRLQRAMSSLPKVRTLVLEWTDPPMGSGHWTPELVEIAGGAPVLGWSGEASRAVSWAEIRAADPEVIVVAPCGLDLSAACAAIDELDRTNTEWRELLRTGRRRVVALDGNAFVNRPGPRLIDTAELFAAAIHPSARSIDGQERALRVLARDRALA